VEDRRPLARRATPILRGFRDAAVKMLIHDKSLAFNVDQVQGSGGGAAQCAAL
jgi:hypothetical protein